MTEKIGGWRRGILKQGYCVSLIHFALGFFKNGFDLASKLLISRAAKITARHKYGEKFKFG